MATILSTIGIVLLWAWSRLGRRAYRTHTAGRLFEIRQTAVVGPFVMLTLLAPLAHLLGDHLAILTGAAAGLAYVRYVALDPLRTGFWFHRRLRPVGTLVFAAVGAGVARFGPAPAVAPLFLAALVFSRYLRLSAAITEQHLADLEAQRRKLIAQTAAALDTTAAKLPIDTLPKAG